MKTALGISFLLAINGMAGPLATIPIELHKGIVFVQVSVNGSVLKLVVDSAATRPVLDIAKAREIGLNIDKAALHGGPHAATPREVRVAENVAYTIGDARVQEPATVVYSFDFLAERIGHPVDGVIGGTMLIDHIVELDYPKREMRIWNPMTYRAPSHGIVIPAEVAGSSIAVRGAIGAVEGLFALDTGAGGTDVILWHHCSSQPSVISGLREVRDMTATAFGGDRPSRKGRMDGLRIGNILLDNVTVQLSDRSPNGSLTSPYCGMLGGSFFERYNTVLDAPHRRVIFVPGAIP
jgi:hypothetical protein